jgi:hypothetical protein
MSSQEQTDRARRDTADEDVTAHGIPADELGEDDPEKKRMQSEAASDEGVEKKRRRR